MISWLALLIVVLVAIVAFVIAVVLLLSLHVVRTLLNVIKVGSEKKNAFE